MSSASDAGDNDSSAHHHPSTDTPSPTMELFDNEVPSRLLRSTNRYHHPQQKQRQQRQRRFVYFLSGCALLVAFCLMQLRQHARRNRLHEKLKAKTVLYNADNSLLPTERAKKKYDDTANNPFNTKLPPPVKSSYFPGVVLHAADALQCRESVLNFVINATDGKDECDGLKRAYDKACSSGGGADGDAINDSDDAAAGVRPPAHDRRRRLLQQERWTYGRKVARIYQPQVWCWEVYLWWQKWQRRWQNPSPFFFAEDAILDVYSDAQLLVQNGVNMDVHAHRIRYWQLEHDERERQKRKRRLLCSDDDEQCQRLEREAPYLADGHADDNSVGTMDNANVTGASSSFNNNKVIMDLPTATKHLSDKQAAESFLLQQGDELLARQVNATLEAAASSKAVADKAEEISSILHSDPHSVDAFTCCRSILNVYHDNCSTDEEEQVSDRKLFFIVFVLAMCGVVKSLVRHYKIYWLPEAAGCILVGVFSGYLIDMMPHQAISFDGNWFLRVLVPPIVFEAAVSIDKRSFHRHVVPIMIYAIVGTLMATVLTAWVLHRGSTMLFPWCHPIPYVEALTFGALISSIDPIAVLSVLSNMGMTDTDTIYVVIFGESLLNDGVSIVLFQTLVHFLDEHLVIDRDAITAASMHFLVVAIGSFLVGVASGMLSTIYYYLFRGCQTPHVEVLMFSCWALLPYYICDGIGWSGIVSAVSAGFVMDVYIIGLAHQGSEGSMEMADDSEGAANPANGASSKRNVTAAAGRSPIFGPNGHLSDEARTHIHFVTEIIATFMETAIFAYLGLFLFSHRYHWNVWHTLLAIFACCASRAVMIPSLSLVANGVTRLQHFRASCQRRRPLSTTATAAAQQWRSGGGGGGASAEKDASNANLDNTAAGVVIDRRMQLVLWFAGLRGAMSFALVEHIPMYDSTSGEGTRWKPELKAMTSACIMFTVFVLGGYTYYMMDAMGLAPSSKASAGSAMEITSLLSKTHSDDAGIANGSTDGVSSHAENGWKSSSQDADGGADIIVGRPANTPNSTAPGRPIRRQRIT